MNWRNNLLIFAFKLMMILLGLLMIIAFSVVLGEAMTGRLGGQSSLIKVLLAIGLAVGAFSCLFD